ncbi:Sec-independent protein translocase protein TatB [Novosphingobium aquimarinum]|uniref:Sec-independent protein translocase protein TatB n=1 Tax=Novosphingobium aquimarinum TaxID=2682494 RepID=UPI0012EBC83F|nr:Sec-independent protein translocase protein TatB [Novosphingobium aquimarinum]
MFDIGATELLLIVIVAVVVIGPKDLPLAMRTAGRWIGKMRKISGHFRAGIDAMVREAEMEDMEKKWRAQNEAIMKAHPTLPDSEEMQPIASAEGAALPVEASLPDKSSASDSPAAESAEKTAAPAVADPGPLGYGALPDAPAESESEVEPQLPLSR